MYAFVVRVFRPAKARQKQRATLYLYPPPPLRDTPSKGGQKPCQQRVTRLGNAPYFPLPLRTSSRLAWQSHKIVGWMKRSASTEYSSNGGTAPQSTPCNKGLVSHGYPMIAVLRIPQHHSSKAFMARRQIQCFDQRFMQSGGCREITGPAGSKAFGIRI